MPDGVLIAGAYAYTTTALVGMGVAFLYLVSWYRELSSQISHAALASATAALAAEHATLALTQKLDQLLDR